MAQDPDQEEEYRDSAEVKRPMVAVLSLDYDGGTPGRADAALIEEMCKKRGFPCFCTTANAHTVFDWPSALLKMGRKHLRSSKKDLCDSLIVVICAKLKARADDADADEDADDLSVEIAQPMPDPDDDTAVPRIEYTVCKSKLDWPLLDKYVENVMGESLDLFRTVPRLYFVNAYEDDAASIKADDERLEKLRMTTKDVVKTRGGEGLPPRAGSFNVMTHRDGALLLAQSGNTGGDEPSAFAAALVELLGDALDDECPLEDFLKDLERASTGAGQKPVLAVQQLGAKFRMDYTLSLA